jgi:hypothetical protein
MIDKSVDAARPLGLESADKRILFLTDRAKVGQPEFSRSGLSFSDESSS